MSNSAGVITTIYMVLVPAAFPCGKISWQKSRPCDKGRLFSSLYW